MGQAYSIAWLLVSKDYPANRMRMEVTVTRPAPGDFADVVVYGDDKCKEPYWVVENKAAGRARKLAKGRIEQSFGNCNSRRVTFGFYEDSDGVSRGRRSRGLQADPLLRPDSPSKPAQSKSYVPPRLQWAPARRSVNTEQRCSP